MLLVFSSACGVAAASLDSSPSLFLFVLNVDEQANEMLLNLSSLRNTNGLRGDYSYNLNRTSAVMAVRPLLEEERTVK